MKKRLHTMIAGLAALCCLLGSCREDELKTFDGPSAAYFDILTNPFAKDDSVMVSFFYNPRPFDTVRLSVTVTGRASNADRYVAIVADTGTTAEADVHYELPPTVKIPAGALTGTLKVPVFAAEDLSEGIKTLCIRIMPNNDFGTEFIRHYSSAWGRYIDPTIFKIYEANVATTPRMWRPVLFGTFSVKKMYVICDVNQVVPAYLNGEQVDGKTISPSEVTVMARMTKLYLIEQELLGNKIMEEDGVTPMEMGPDA